MQSITKLLLVLVFMFPTASARAGDVENISRDLVGHSMGGRARCWRFQSETQIRGLVVLDQTHSGEQRSYTIRCTLRDPRVRQPYEAKAIVRYRRIDSEWRVESVGLISMVKVLPTER
jgi:hypothetical protein